MRVLLFLSLAVLSFVVPDDSIATPQLRKNEKTFEFFQPRKDQMDSASKIINTIDAAKYPKVGEFPLVDGVPYYKYWLLDNGAYAFHPHAVAGALSILARENRLDALDDLLERVTPLSSELPNGGITWFYPKVYSNNRMVGPLYHYSVICSGAINRCDSSDEL